MTSVATVQTLASLMAGRNIVLREQTAVDIGEEPGPPQTTSDGIDVSDGGGSIVAWALMRLRQNVSFQRSLAQVTDLEIGSTYTVAMNYGDGVESYSYVSLGGDAEEDILQELADLINADIPQKWAAVVAGAGAAAVLTIDGIPSVSFLPYSMSAGVTAGPGSMSFTAESGEVTFRVWGLPKGSTAWHRLPVEGRPDATSDKVSALQNYAERYMISGMDRMFIEVVRTDGSVTPIVAPALEE